MEPSAVSPPTPPAREVYTVSRLNREVRAMIEGAFPVLWVEGELSNLARPASGHMYFSLKDPHCQVRCAMFRARNTLLAFRPENGMQVLLRARVGFYEGRGEFQLVVEHMEPAGDGALRLAFEQLKQKLSKAGLFDEAHKRSIPRIPRCIGVITSPTGAAIRDILHVLQRRFPAIPLIVYPVPVQGQAAAPAIARALDLAAQRAECDVLLLARGGGSLEDLWAFNEEIVARAVYECSLPVVSGVGHEIDFTIADLVADRRAPTPSAAAELVSPDRQQLGQALQAFERHLRRDLQASLARRGERLGWLAKRLGSPQRRLEEIGMRLDETHARLLRALRAALTEKHARIERLGITLQRLSPLHTAQTQSRRNEHLRLRLEQAFANTRGRLEARLAELSRALDAVSPLATLQRGYAIVTRLPDGRIVRDASELSRGDRLDARFARGSAACTVDETSTDESQAR